jgi:hypothetical protein
LGVFEVVRGGQVMRYMIRNVFNCKRGQVPVVLDDLKVVIEVMKSQGITDHKVYVDIAQTMDTVFHRQCEVDSLDRYFDFERGVYINPEEQVRALLERYNANTVSGRREIYEVIV